MKKLSALLWQSLIVFGSVSAMTCAHSAVTYSFVGGPAAVGYDTNGQGFSTPAGMNPANTAFPVPSFNASLSFSNALAASATTTISYEAGGNNLITSGVGGVSAFSASGFPLTGLVINSSLGIISTNPNSIQIDGISVVTGFLTTNAGGDIIGWDLDFQNFRLAPTGNSIWTGPGPRPAGFPNLSTTSVRTGVFLNSASSAFSRSALTAVDGNSTINAVNATVFDYAFLDGGATQANRYNVLAGTWSSNQVVSVPLPSGLALLFIGSIVSLVARKRAVK
jgi:hypothetical protein